MFDQLIKELTNHYAQMAMNPHTLGHARHQVRSLRDDPTGMFVDLAELVKVKIEELKNEKEKVQA